MPQELQEWLKNSIFGIVLLGAVGSLLAVVLGRILLAIKEKVLPAPYQAHRRSQRKQAYFLGYVHATIESDQTNRRLIAFLAYRMTRFGAAGTLFLFFVVLATNALVFQAQVLLTLSVFLCVVGAFLSVYWAYFEFEYVYRTYLWLWKRPLEHADERFKARSSKAVSDSHGSPSENAG